MAPNVSKMVELENLGTWELATSLYKKNHATSWDRKKHATSWDKKSRNLLGPKKFTQPLGTKKNHASSQDKKKSQPPRTKTNHATSWDKKKSSNLLGHKKKQPTKTHKSQNKGHPAKVRTSGLVLPWPCLSGKPWSSGYPVTLIHSDLTHRQKQTCLQLK